MKKSIISLLIVLAILAGLTACGKTGNQQSVDKNRIVNIGVTGALGSFNPFAMDMIEMNHYCCSLMFLPLVELDSDLNFQPMLADSISTSDNKTFTVHIDDKAVWSDGTPVTAADLEYTVRRLCSPVVANAVMMMYVFEGVDGDTGFVEENAQQIDGIQIVDDKTVQFITKEPMSLSTFENGYARYFHTLPKHIIEKIEESDLKTNAWFQKPDVVSGPYFVTDYDAEHYVSYQSNPAYFKGAPKIEKLNFKVLPGSQILSGLQSGEIDLTHPTLSAIPETDYESIEALDQIEVNYSDPVTHQSVFIQTANITDARIRLAMLYAIDREKLVKDLLKGHGEVVDGFVSSASPYYDSAVEPVPYDPEKARQLLSEAGYDSTRVLRFYINSGDATFMNAAAVMVEQWKQVGIQTELKTVDFNTLMTVCGTTDYDLLAVQYTYPPADYTIDISYLLNGEGSWTGYQNDTVTQAMQGLQMTSDVEQMKQLYTTVDKKMQEDVPMFSAYVIRTQSAVNKRLTGVKPGIYGFFNNIQEWNIQ